MICYALPSSRRSYSDDMIIIAYDAIFSLRYYAIICLLMFADAAFRHYYAATPIIAPCHADYAFDALRHATPMPQHQPPHY